MDLGAPITDVENVSTGAKDIENGVVRAEGYKPIVLVPNDSNVGDLIYVGWIEPFLWEGAQIAAIDTPSVMLYEGLWLGLQYVWQGLAGEVNDLARSIEKDQANSAQQEKIDSHEVNRVPQDDEPVAPARTFNDGETQGVSDEGSSADM